jgi:hypothetical protein
MASKESRNFAEERPASVCRRALAAHRGVTEHKAALQTSESKLDALHNATDALHGTFDRLHVLQTIEKIAMSLGDCDEVAVFELDQSGKRLVLVASSGIEAKGFGSIPLGVGLIGGAAESGEFYERFCEPDAVLVSERHLRICIPLMMDRTAVGAIAIFDCSGKDLVHEPVDRELFEIFARHAASALYWSGLYDRARAALNSNW